MSREYVEKRLREIRTERRPITMPLPRYTGYRSNERYTKPRVLEPSRRQPLHEDCWIGPELKILSIPEILALHKIDGSARRPGIYFLLRGPQTVVYIGSAINVRTRVGNHDLDRGPSSGLSFDAATYMPIPWPWYLAVEALYIRHYKPEWNSTYAGPKDEKP